MSYSENMSKAQHVSARVDDSRKESYQKASDQLGYESMTAFMLATMDAVTGSVSTVGWECQLIHIEGDRIVAVGEEFDGLPSTVTAFPIVAPARFWRRLKQTLSKQDKEWGIGGM